MISIRIGEQYRWVQNSNVLIGEKLAWGREGGLLRPTAPAVLIPPGAASPRRGRGAGGRAS